VKSKELSYTVYSISGDPRDVEDFLADKMREAYEAGKHHEYILDVKRKPFDPKGFREAAEKVKDGWREAGE
jgi:hypothetical protein